MKLSEILIGILVMVVVVSGFSSFYASLLSEYAPTDYNSTLLTKLNSSYNDIENISVDMQTDLNKLEGDPSATDVLSAFFTSSYGALKISLRSLDTFFSIIGTSVSGLPLGSMSSIIIGVLSTIVIIALIVGILLAVVTKVAEVL